MTCWPGWRPWPTSAWWRPATCTSRRPRRRGSARRWPRSRAGAAWPGWVRGGPGAVGRDCAFDCSVLAPRLPDFGVPAGYTEASWLRELVARKAPSRYGPPGAERIPGAYAQIARELDVIERLEFP